MKVQPTGCAECLDVGKGERSQGCARLWARATGRIELGSEVEKPKVELTGGEHLGLRAAKHNGGFSPHGRIGCCVTTLSYFVLVFKQILSALVV